MNKIAIIIIILSIIVTITGCDSLLEDYIEIISHHEIPPYERPPVELPTIATTGEIKDLLLELIQTHETQTTVRYTGIENDNLQAEILEISQEILNENPTAAYAVADISLTATRIVSYSEIIIDIEYKRTAEQVSSIFDVTTQRYLITQLLDMMSLYREEAVFLTNLKLEREDIVARIAELYYQNPRSIIMMPVITIETFPEEDITDDDANNEYKIYEIKFGYSEDIEILRGFGVNLNTSIRQNAKRADGDTDGEVLLSLVTNLIAGAEYEEGAAGTIAMHGQQNISATAYGALVRGTAVGEGFAMAFKALCDELRLDCRVVLGRLTDERFHAWNIVLLDGAYYHIDTAMCAVNGLEAGFLKTDDDFAKNYIWDKETTPVCNGTLTLSDFLPQINNSDGTTSEND